jgi:predicted RNA-binding protein YlqC (UPF0109 family)
MKGLVEHIFKSLVTKPKAVEIKKKVQEGVINFNVKVDPEDMGLVIGRQGNTIRAIRTLVKTRALVEKKRVQLTLEEVNT